jgi:hypothetical protein
MISEWIVGFVGHSGELLQPIVPAAWIIGSLECALHYMGAFF